MMMRSFHVDGLVPIDESSRSVPTEECPVLTCTVRASLTHRHPPTLDAVDNRQEVREFLSSRRARITPEQAGLPAGGNRRVPGLRRGEVANLADVSVEYYGRLERGQIGGASSAVLDAIADALQLDDTERAHLFDLARAADGVPTSGRSRGRRMTSKTASRPSMHWLLASLKDSVAGIVDQRMNLLATNDLGRAFYAPVIGDGGRTPNLARFQFLDPVAQDFYPDWELFAEMCVAVMRAKAGQDPHDKEMQDLVGELSTRSDTFRTLWAAHNVRTHGTGSKRFDHPVVGELTLAYEELLVTAEPGIALMTYTAEPGSPSAERLRLLASWAASTTGDTNQEETPHDANQR
jgi:transcriptional regulator with XRE-family HTH domain